MVIHSMMRVPPLGEARFRPDEAGTTCLRVLNAPDFHEGAGACRDFTSMKRATDTHNLQRASAGETVQRELHWK